MRDSIVLKLVIMFVFVMIGNIPLCMVEAPTVVFFIWGGAVGWYWNEIWNWICDKFEKKEDA